MYCTLESIRVICVFFLMLNVIVSCVDIVSMPTVLLKLLFHFSNDLIPIIKIKTSLYNNTN